jgi:hypothetical protein
VPGAANPATVYAIPTARDVAVLACVGPAGVARDCESIAATLRVAKGRALPLGPSPSYAKDVTGVVSALVAGLGADRRALAADTAERQTDAAAAIAKDYRAAAADVGALRPAPADRGATAGLRAALVAASRAYGDVAARARAGDAAGHARAAATAERRERRVRRSLRAFRRAGYEVGR